MAASLRGLDYSLDALDVTKFDAFTVCSPVFWRRKPDVVLQFFATLRELDFGSAFLATQDEAVCRGVRARDSSIACVVSRRMDNQSTARDTMMSMERWHVALHFLERGRRILHVGADMRFTRPLRCLYAACGDVDAAFDGAVDKSKRVLAHFTPDLLLFMPTPNAISFVQSTLEAFRAPTLAGLEPELQSAELLAHRKFLMGPGQQDLLLDHLWTTLYGRPVNIRKTTLARHAVAGFPRGAELQDNQLRKQLGPLPSVCAQRGGLVVRTPRLRVLMMLHTLVIGAQYPCRDCDEEALRHTPHHGLTQCPHITRHLHGSSTLLMIGVCGLCVCGLCVCGVQAHVCAQGDGLCVRDAQEQPQL